MCGDDLAVGAADQEIRRDALHGVFERSRRIESLEIADLDPLHLLVGDGFHPCVAFVVERHGVDFESLFAVFFIVGLQIGNLPEAGAAPRGPEVDEDVFVGGIFDHGFERYRFVVGVRGGDVDIGLSHRRAEPLLHDLAQVGQFGALLPLGGEAVDLGQHLLRREEHRPRFGQYDHAADVVAVAVDRFAHLLLVAVDQLFLVSLQFGDAVGFAGVECQFVEGVHRLVGRGSGRVDLVGIVEVAVDRDAGVFEEEPHEGLLLVPAQVGHFGQFVLAREGEGARFDFGRVGHAVRAVEGNQIDVGRFQALDVAANRVTVRRAGTQEEQGRCECVNAFHGKMYKFG